MTFNSFESDTEHNDLSLSETLTDAKRYIVVNDRYANEPCICTLAEFYAACEELGWDKPDLHWRSDDTYWDHNGEIVLRPAI